MYRRLAFGSSPSPEDLIPVDLQTGANKVQQLEVWNPGELETKLFMYEFLALVHPAN